MNKIISYCLYDTINHNLNRFPEYLVGLLLNIKVKEILFPDWKIKLYIKILNPLILSYITEISKKHDIELINVHKERHPMIARYEPFIDKTIDICIVRDLDSILSKTDKRYIEYWLHNHNKYILNYKEYMQNKNCAMGGGLGIKVQKLKLWDKLPYIGVNSYNDEYNKDEEYLYHKILKKVNKKYKTFVITRMSEYGNYYIKNKELLPTSSDVLWLTTFTNLCEIESYFFEINEMLKNVSKKYDSIFKDPNFNINVYIEPEIYYFNRTEMWRR